MKAPPLAPDRSLLGAGAELHWLFRGCAGKPGIILYWYAVSLQPWRHCGVEKS